MYHEACIDNYVVKVNIHELLNLKKKSIKLKPIKAFLYYFIFAQNLA